MNKDREYYFKDSPKKFARNDFWRQVNRTIHGEPVDEKQIVMLVQSIIQGLDLKNGDVVLDLCCGNGAITSQIAQISEKCIGVDFSEYLIGIAKEFFELPETCEFYYDDIIEFCSEHQIASCTKAYCYGASSYLSNEQISVLLTSLYNNFEGLTQIFIGNCPDKEFKREFFQRRKLPFSEVETTKSAIGIWRNSSTLISIANECGWEAEVSKMPAEYHAAYYKYDLILTRVNK